ncbi:MAG: KpsF/GutQ family sugar-phosphate isomerase [Phycisphaerales bacterium]|nr:KpsF/GutQ family sugar-phosphate isomerase [Phycisphaerales bacterium]
MKTALEIARQVVCDEAVALQQLADGLGAEFEEVVETLHGLTTEGPHGAAGLVLVSGLGKSGNIGQKIAASLTSTGTPAVFMHPVEALHGDLGIVTPRHSLIALSRSGDTDEIVRFVAYFRRLGGPVIGLTQRRVSRLAELCQHLILLPDAPEAGPLSLAPTTSCALMLAAGDALAMGLLHRRGFQAEDFARYHPEGALGRRLLLRARDLMHGGTALPVVAADCSFAELVMEMTRKRLGLALIVGSDGRLLGTFTDGDLRRIFERVANPRALDARAAFTQSRRTADAPAVHVSWIQPEHLAVDCLRIMRESQITSLIVTDAEERPVGVLRWTDLLSAGLG